jgi:hypothetical protein
MIFIVFQHHRALVLKSEAECYLHEGITAAALAAECYLKVCMRKGLVPFH